MYVASGTGDVHTTESFDKIPSLTNCSGELSLKLDERVVVDGRAAAVFDIFAGTLDAFRHQAKTSSIWAKLTVPTPQPELRVMRIWDQQDGTIPLRPSADDRVDVWLVNVGANPKRERKNDFLLHYHVTNWVPSSSQVKSCPDDNTTIRLASEEELQNVPPPFNGLSMGCSNSIYP